MMIQRLRNKSQGTLEMSVIFVIVVFFLVSIVKIAIWSDAQVAGRQQAYQGTRLEAGTAYDFQGGGYPDDPAVLSY